VRVDFKTGTLINITSNNSIRLNPFNEVQMEIYLKGGLLGK
jgi:hypothetical protein